MDRPIPLALVKLTMGGDLCEVNLKSWDNPWLRLFNPLLLGRSCNLVILLVEFTGKEQKKPGLSECDMFSNPQKTCGSNETHKLVQRVFL